MYRALAIYERPHVRQRLERRVAMGPIGDRGE
jgi:hypothetical protein